MLGISLPKECHNRRKGQINMKRRMFLSKIHRATVTDANLDYEGSCTIDANLMDAADIIENQELHIWNVTRGTRLVTYALKGSPGSGVICINGSAAHGNEVGDLVILSTFGEMSDDEARMHTPKVILVDESNRIKGKKKKLSGPLLV